MTLMERAVLGDCLHLLVKKSPPQTGWRKTKTVGYHCVRRTGMLNVKQAKTGKRYLVVDQTMLADQWFKTAEEAMQRGDQL
jgi:glucan-binding YG repeat protein